jgi:5'-methylthioadenosine phosphorylase
MKPLLIVSQGAVDRRHQTPFGTVGSFTTAEGLTAIVRGEGQDARARIWAAKVLGATAILALESVEATLPLLEEGDIVIPADVIDQTRLKPHTFFPGKGYGFIQMSTPFCPAWSGALLAAAREAQPRTFQRAVYVGTEGPRELTPAERAMYAQWNVHVAGTELLPEPFLARELELCYAALTVIGRRPLPEHLSILAQAAAHAPATGCNCGEAMARSKAAGTVGPNWRSWVVLPE